MTTLILVLACLLGLAHIIAAIMVETRIRGTDWNAGARDEPAPDLPPIVGRLQRAQTNFLETFPFFAALLLACMIQDVADWRVIAGGWIYLAARAIYLPLYAQGVPKVRTLIWLVAMLGVALVGWAAALP